MDEPLDLVLVKAPDGVSTLAIEGQRFQVQKDGVFALPPALVACALAHFEGMARHAASVAAARMRERKEAARSDVRAAMKLLEAELARLGL